MEQNVDDDKSLERGTSGGIFLYCALLKAAKPCSSKSVFEKAGFWCYCIKITVSSPFYNHVFADHFYNLRL